MTLMRATPVRAIGAAYKPRPGGLNGGALFGFSFMLDASGRTTNRWLSGMHFMRSQLQASGRQRPPRDPELSRTPPARTRSIPYGFSLTPKGLESHELLEGPAGAKQADWGRLGARRHGGAALRELCRARSAPRPSAPRRGCLFPACLAPWPWRHRSPTRSLWERPRGYRNPCVIGSCFPGVIGAHFAF